MTWQELIIYFHYRELQRKLHKLTKKLNADIYQLQAKTYPSDYDGL